MIKKSDRRGLSYRMLSHLSRAMEDESNLNVVYNPAKPENVVSSPETNLAARAVPHLRVIELLPLQEAVYALAHTQRSRKAVSTQRHARIVLNLQQDEQAETNTFEARGKDTIQSAGCVPRNRERWERLSRMSMFHVRSCAERC